MGFKLPQHTLPHDVVLHLVAIGTEGTGAISSYCGSIATAIFT